MNATKITLLFKLVLLLGVFSCASAKHAEAFSTNTSSDRFFDGAKEKSIYNDPNAAENVVANERGLN